MGKKENIEKILLAFREKPALALEKSALRREEVHLRIPGIKKIDDELADVGLRVFSETRKGGADVRARVEKIRHETADLNKRRAELLVKNGYPADYTSPKYECEKCSDTGYVGIDMCDCLRHAIIFENYKTSGLGGMLFDQTFDNFDLSVYPDSPRDRDNPRKTMQDILLQVRRYADSFDLKQKPASLLFMGATGLGKTHLSSALARALLEKGYEVVYESAPNVFHTLEKERFSSNKIYDTSKFFDCDFLIIDDLGTEFFGKTTVSDVYNLINTRLLSGKPTLISTNLTAKELEKLYENRVISRLFGMFDLFLFRGEDVRFKRIGDKS